MIIVTLNFTSLATDGSGRLLEAPVSVAVGDSSRFLARERRNDARMRPLAMDRLIAVNRRTTDMG